jgi:hypothetical protein
VNKNFLSFFGFHLPIYYSCLSRKRRLPLANNALTTAAGIQDDLPGGHFLDGKGTGFLAIDDFQ